MAKEKTKQHFEHLAIIEHFRNQTNKLAYYIIALCVASIGFSVTQTIGDSLSCSQIPLGVAIVCWSYSTYIGLKLLKKIIDVLRENNDAYDFKYGHKKLKIEGVKYKRKEAFQITMNNADIIADKAKKLPILQKRSFIIGIAFFLLWRVIEMYLIT